MMLRDAAATPIMLEKRKKKAVWQSVGIAFALTISIRNDNWRTLDGGVYEIIDFPRVSAFFRTRLAGSSMSLNTIIEREMTISR